MNALDYEISSGYIGSFGRIYETATEESLEAAIAAAVEYNSKTRDEVVRALDSGCAVAWQRSPNFYYDHSEGVIRHKRTIKTVQLVMCNCGHEVPAGQRMSASLGSSCPDCYDRMSD